MGKEIPNIHRKVNSGYKVALGRSSCLLYLAYIHSYMTLEHSSEGLTQSF